MKNLARLAASAPEIKQFDVSSAALERGREITIPVSLSSSEDWPITEVKLQFASDGVNFIDVQTFTSLPSNIDWKVPLDKTPNARLQLIVTNAANKSNTKQSIAFAITDPPPLVAPDIKVSPSNLSSLTSVHQTSVDILVSNCNLYNVIYLSENQATPKQDSSEWKSCDSSTGIVSFSMSSGDGIKQVYSWGKNYLEEISPSSTLSLTLDTVAPAVSYSSAPASGALLKGGNTSLITFSASDGLSGLASIKLEYASDGSSFAEIANLSTSTTSYSWTVPAENVTTARLKLSVLDVAGNSASALTGPFSIDSATPTLSLTSMTGGQVLPAGSTQSITWTATDANFGATPIQILYSSDGGSSWTPLAASTSNSGSFSWNVPSVDSSTYQIRIIATDLAGNQTTVSSSSNFSIDNTNPTVSLTSLTGGQIVNIGSSQNITWTASDTNFGSSSIKLEYSADGGTTWSTIAAGNSNSGSFNWTVPSMTPTNQAKVRITATDLALHSVTSASASNFTITGAPSKLVVTGPASVTAGGCSTIFTVTSQDSSSQSANVATNTTINLTSGGVGGFYTNSNCTSSVSSVTINTGGTNQTFYYKAGTTAQNVTVTASDGASVLTSGTLGVTINPASVSQLTFSTQPSSSGTVGVNLSTQPAVTLKDTYGNTVSSAAQGVSLTAFTDSTCQTFATGTLNSTTNPVTPISGIATFSGINYNLVGTIYLKASASGATSTCSTAIALNAGTATKLAISGINSVSSGFCSSPLTVTAQDAQGNAVNLGANTTVNLSSSLGGSFYTDSSCSSSTSSIQINSGSNSQTFYFKDNTQENPTVTASVSGLTSGSMTFKVQDFTSIVTGYWHSCAIANGAAYCWGNNNYNQLGDNTNYDRNVPTQVYGLSSNVTAIAAQDYHSCAIVNGAVKCWGANNSGALGDNTTTARTIPTQVLGITSGATSVSVGVYFSCAVVNGAAKCWGYNPNGGLGNGTTTDSSIPVQVSGLTSGVTQVAAGYYHACAVVNGGAQCWGYNANGQLGNNSTTDSSTPVQVQGLTSGVVSLTSFIYTTCALLNTGAVQCWGHNAYGQLGNNSATNSSIPVQVQGITSGATMVSSGLYYSCAVVSGAAKCWGYNSHGELGNNSTTLSQVPVQVSGLTSGVTAISAGGHTCAIVNGGIQCWGTSSYGNLGNAKGAYSLVPVLAQGISGTISSLAPSTSGNSNAVLLQSGGLLAWGRAEYNELGNGSNINRSTAVQTSGLTSGVTASAAGQWGTCAVVSGAAKCWGDNRYGQIGDNSTTSRNTPTQVLGLSSGVTAIAKGDLHACAVVSGGVQCWGYNSKGQLGNSTTTNSSFPVQAQGITSGATAIAGGQSFTCAIVNGGAQCWGYNGYGQLGNNSLTSSSVPVQVQGLTSGVTAIATGQTHACALSSDGTMKCWGYNGWGSLGNNSLTNSSVPVSPLGLSSGVTSISAGSNTSCAVVNGAAQCWGTNLHGELGNNSNNYSKIPVQVQGLSAGVLSIIGGLNHNCTLLDTNSVACWGSNNYGQLGYGNVMELTPVLTGPWP